jgi:RNA polymerase sigma factor (sigma-70 family)
MKVRIEGHTVVVNKMSIYIDGLMEFQAVNMITEYGQKLNGCKYAVASRYSRERLEELYTENLKKFSPFIYLTEAEYEPIREANNNNNKHHMRDVNNHDDYGYTEDMMEVMHECTLLLADPEPDVLTAIIERDDAALRDRQIAALTDALATLTEKQRRRMVMHFYEGMTFKEIADREGTYVNAIDYSIQSSKKKLAKFLKKVF